MLQFILTKSSISNSIQKCTEPWLHNVYLQLPIGTDKSCNNAQKTEANFAHLDRRMGSPKKRKCTERRQ